MLLYFRRLSYTDSLCLIFCSLKVICLGVGVLLIINFAFLNFSLVFSKLSESIIWCVNNVRNFSHHCFKYYILLFLLLNCYSYVHIIHFNIAPQFLDVFLFFLFTFLFVWFIQIYLQVQGILYFCCCLLFLAFLSVSILEFSSLLTLLIHFCHLST